MGYIEKVNSIRDTSINKVSSNVLSSVLKVNGVYKKLIITLVNTTDPTNIAGNNGTATISFAYGVGPYTYTLNSVSQGSAVSPLVINGLLASTSYTVQIKDSNNYTVNTTFTLGQSSFYFDADYIMLTYEFTDGTDLDTKTRMAIPNIGQNTTNDYLGYLAGTGSDVMQWPPLPAIPILSFSGDNTGTGFESVLIDVKQFKINYPLSTSFTVDARCLWWIPTSVGLNDVIIAATLWKNASGGAPEQSGFIWINPSATRTGSIDSVGVKITTTSAVETLRGQRAATLTYNLNTKIGVLNNNDTTTPTV